MVVERGDFPGAWYWKGLSARNLAFENKCACGHKWSTECLSHVLWECIQESQLKHVVIGKAKKSQLFKGIKAYCIPVYYDNQEAWINGEIFDNWLHKHFVPEVQAFLKDRGLPQKVMLLLQSVPSLIKESVVTSNNGLIVELPTFPNVAAFI
jgi:hypothetical protein